MRSAYLGSKKCEIPRLRDFVVAGVPARTFSVGNAAVWSVQHPRSLGTFLIWVAGSGVVKGVDQLVPKLSDFHRRSAPSSCAGGITKSLDIPPVFLHFFASATASSTWHISSGRTAQLRKSLASVSASKALGRRSRTFVTCDLPSRSAKITGKPPNSART